ncbi:MAG: phenylalanine--tRNA ligase subunit beta [Candidatus Caldarchaeum sp.]
MPVVNIRVRKLLRLLGVEISLEELGEHLASLGLSVEETADDVLRVEYNPNRPDFSSVYGVARVLKGFLGIETGSPKYLLKKPRVKMYVDNSVANVRPFIACSIVRGLELGEEELEEMIAMQEDLHWTLGRNRRKMAIGLHDISAIIPPFTYKAVGPEEVKFTPLKDYRKMTLKEALVKNEIARKYAPLVANYPRYPVIVDSRGEVFSMPPVVNAALTELNLGVRDVFIDVTGTEWSKVSQALNILVAAMADMGGKVEQVKVVYGSRVRVTPEMHPGKMVLKTELASSLTGLDLTPAKAAKLLRRMRMDARVSGKRVVVRYPAYRVDLLHPVDLVEDISIAYGYNRMTPQRPASNTYGKLLPQTELLEKIAEIMVGLGYTEVHNLMLTNENLHYAVMQLDEERHVRLANPATREYTMLRTSLIPSILFTLTSNKDNLYPQRVFEIGDVIILDETRPEKVVRYKRLAAATAHAEADYTEIKSTLDELFKLLKLKPSYVPAEKNSFMQGRCASLQLDGVEVGVAGEVSPTVLENLGLTMPVAAFEIMLEKILR